MKAQYAVVDSWSDGPDLARTLNQMAEEGYHLTQVVQGFISEHGGATPLLIMELSVPCDEDESLEDFAALTEAGRNILSLHHTPDEPIWITDQS